MALDTVASIALYSGYPPLQRLIFALDLLGLILLTILLLTVNLSERVHRHPVFINFLCTWVLYSSLKTFADFAAFSFGTIKHRLEKSMSEADWVVAEMWSSVVFNLFGATLEDILWMITQASTLNLVIHLWYTMKSVLRADPPRVEKQRTALLVMTPYMFGLLPMIELVPAFDVFSAITVSSLEVVLIIITSIWDLTLLVTFWRRRRILKRIHMENIMSLGVLTKLLIFSLFRLIITPIFITAGITEATPLVAISLIAQSLYPLLAFVLLGMTRDVMNIWFPTIIKHPGKHQPLSQTFILDISSSRGAEIPLSREETD